MRIYNPMTVIRQTSRTMLKAFFAEQKCLECLDFTEDKLYEIQEAFRALPDRVLRRVELVMRHVFNFAGSESVMIRLMDEAQQRGINIADELDSLTSRYDKAFYIYLHHRDLWERTCVFAQVDMLGSRHWTRCPNLPKITPRTDAAARLEMGKQISAFFWQKQVRGKKYLIEYQKRTGNLHYFFVYLSDYANSYEAWSEHGCELERRDESRAINMVFAYDEHFGTLDTYNLGGVAVARVLQRIFCDTILQYELIDEQILKSAFQIDRLKYRKNQPMPMPEIGVMRVRISCFDFAYAGVGQKRRHRITIDDAPNDDEIYEVMEHDLNRDHVPLNLVNVRFVRLLLDIELDGEKRKMVIELTSNSCNLKSNVDELRLIGEKFILENGIDVQPKLF